MFPALFVRVIFLALREQTLKNCQNQHDRASEQMKILARLAGIEPTTLGFGGQYSIH
jgi:hypothetical protein